MMTNVPQFIDVEDKVAGPFTWKQLGWMLAMGGVLFLLYTIVDKSLFYVAAVPVALLFLALAFYRPNGMTLASFIFYSVGFLFRPKVMVWERPTQPVFTSLSNTPKEAAEEEPEKRLSVDEIAALARQVDRKR